MDRRERAEDRFLVLRCQAGDDVAYTDLYRRYYAPLLYYLRRMLASPESSEDVLQNVWIKILRGITTLREPEAFRTWIYRIAHTEALMWLRKHGQALELERMEVATAAMEQEEEDSTVADEDINDAQSIHAAVGELSPAQREVLVLRYLEDLSYDEIASVTGIGVGTVRSRLHYAKRSLKKVMEDRQLCKTRTG